MADHVIKMPDIGEGIAEVELSAWHVQPGDEVTEDQVLADVMTDKATVEIPSPVAGRVSWLGGEAGQVFAVGQELIRIETQGDAKPARAPARAAAAAASAASTSRSTTSGAAAAAKTAPAAAATAAPATARPPSAPAAAPASRAAPAGERPIASPSVRRRAWELGIDLAQVRASGTAGRIMHADLDAYAKTQPASQRPAAAAMPAPAVPALPSSAPREGEQAIAVIGLRRKIALKMREAKRRIPHFSYVEECDVTELEALRRALNERHGAARGKLTLLPFLMRAIAVAVVEHPEVNALFDDDKGILTRHAAVHIGIATQTDVGLMVPVVRHAEALDLWGAASEVARLAAAARAGNITRGELSGSTITITSLGADGGIVTTPIINHPEVAIVGVNRIVERPMFAAGGAIVPRQLMNLSSSFDHRVVDGYVAAQFVQALRALLEAPATLFVG